MIYFLWSLLSLGAAFQGPPAVPEGHFGMEGEPGVNMATNVTAGMPLGPKYIFIYFFNFFSAMNEDYTMLFLIKVYNDNNGNLYRVSHKQRNGGFSVACDLKVPYLFTSSNQATPAEENDTKIIKFY